MNDSDREARVIALLEDRVRTELQVTNGGLRLGLGDEAIESLMEGVTAGTSTASRWIGRRTGCGRETSTPGRSQVHGSLAAGHALSTRQPHRAARRLPPGRLITRLRTDRTWFRVVGMSAVR
jgi:hypothetical protein